MGLRIGQKLPDTLKELDGVTKAAVVLVALEPEIASQVLKRMSGDVVEEVTREIAGLGMVPEKLRSDVIEEFYGYALAQQYSSEGSLDYAKELLRQSMDPKLADRIIGQIQTQVQRTPFAFLQKAEAENLLTFIQDEHPQTIALIVCHLAHHKAAEILAALPAQKQIGRAHV